MPCSGHCDAARRREGGAERRTKVRQVTWVDTARVELGGEFAQELSKETMTGANECWASWARPKGFEPPTS